MMTILWGKNGSHDRMGWFRNETNLCINDVSDNMWQIS